MSTQKNGSNLKANEDHDYFVTKVAETLHEFIFRDNEDYNNLERYLEIMRIEVYYAELDELDGYLKININTGLPRIVIKANQYDSRQRFTMAYELGSLVLNYKYHPGIAIDEWKKKNEIKEDQILDINMTRGSNSKEELRLNKFAAAFLMPSNKILKLAQEYQEEYGRKIKSSELIKLICGKFFVSESAAKLRLKELNLL